MGQDARAHGSSKIASHQTCLQFAVKSQAWRSSGMVTCPLSLRGGERRSSSIFSPNMFTVPTHTLIAVYFTGLQINTWLSLASQDLLLLCAVPLAWL